MISNEAIIGVAVAEAWQALADHEDGWLRRAQAARARWSDKFRSLEPAPEDVRTMFKRAEHLIDAAISHRIECRSLVTDAGRSLMWPEDEQ